MKRTKKQVIDKILSFNYIELAQWMKSRLHGDDKYFPIYEGYETNLSEFLTETYENIKDEKFRDNFLEILNDLTAELSGFSTREVQKEAEYIYELLSLCASIKQFDNTDILYEIAVSGDLKGVKAFDLELHQLLLNTLASFKLSGDYEFWFDQMRDDSNKYYANAAFYALLNRVIAGHSIDILFKKKKKHGDRYEDRLCFFDEGNGKVGKNKINLLGPIKQDIKNELQKKSNRDRYDHLELIVISQNGFTRGATAAAKTYGIKLRTLGQLVDELIQLDTIRKKSILDSKSI